MRSLKIICASLVISSLVIMVSAFSTKNILKKVDFVTFYFTGAHKFIGTGNVNSLVQAEVTSSSNWTLTSTNPGVDDGSFLFAIIFDLDLISLGDAINGLWNYYVNNEYTLPNDGDYIVVNSVQITIRRRP